MKRHVLRFEQASFLVVVMLTAFLMISCIPRNPNTPPVADFKLVESSATELRQLHFDASTSTDKEDSTDKLIARWDFNGDGVWEIDYSANKKANEVVSHSYNVAGTTTVIVEVKDSKGLTSRREKEIQINLAPPESLYLGSASGQEITIIWDDISTSEDSYNVSLNDNPLEQLPANTEEYTFELDTSATQTISVYCTKGTMKSNKTELVMGMNLSESTTVFEEVSVTLPASHVGKKVTIAVTEPSEELPEGCNVESTAYDINVDGLTDEATESPVEVTFTSEFVESEENNDLIMMHYDDYLGEWIPAYTVFQNGKYKTFTTHFSTYVLTSVETSSEILSKRVDSYSVQDYGLNFVNSPGDVLDAGKLLDPADFTSQGGVCYGMVMTSLGLFKMGLGFADPFFDIAGDLEPRLYCRSAFNMDHGITCTPVAEFVEIKQEDGPGLISCLERLIDRTFTDNITNANNTYLLLAEGIPVVLSLGRYEQDVDDEDNDGDKTEIIRRGHAVLAYGVKVEGSSVYVFSIYDPNFPQVNRELTLDDGKIIGYYGYFSEMLCIGVDSRTGPGRMTLLTENLDKSYSPWFKDIYYYINDNSIKLSWWNHCRPDRSLPSSQYIKRSEGGTFSSISTINSMSVENYADTNIEVNEEYKYKVSRSDGKETPEVSVFTRYYDAVPETGAKVNEEGFTVTLPQLPSGNIIVNILYFTEGTWKHLTFNKGFSNYVIFTEDDCDNLFRNSDSATIRFVAYNNDYDRTYAVRDVTYYLTDNTPPTVTKVSGPNGEISESSSTFTWTGSDSDGTITKYEYRKDEGSWASNGMSTGYTWSDYSKGDHKFEVRAQDDEGDYSNIISWSFTYSTGTIVVGEMVLVEGGTFMMGDEFGNLWDGCRPVHEVTLTYDFYMGKYEVTFDEYDAFCDATGRSKPYDWGWGRGQRPVMSVSWWDAIAYCNWLSVENGLPVAYRIKGEVNEGELLDSSGNVTTDITEVIGYRLPTEAEWEYAARGGKHNSPYKYSGSDTVGDVAWYDSNSGRKTQEVGKKAPNELGLYDMSGNVWEWCSDWYGDYPSSAQTNPYNSTAGSYRVFRGGSWAFIATYTRVAYRILDSPTSSVSDLGFRVARTVP